MIERQGTDPVWDDLETTIDEWAKDDPEIRVRIEAALQRRTAEAVRPAVPGGSTGMQSPTVLGAPE